VTSKAPAELERDVLETEWKECRETIRNFDRNLTTLRVYSLIAILALMGVSTDLFARGRSDAALIATGVTMALVSVVLFLERHYRGYLLITVDRAIALEKKLKGVYKKQPLQADLDQLKIRVACKETSAMITEVIKEGHDSYNWFVRNAHILVYIILILSNFALLIIFLGAFLFPVR